jgi:hypothetical protein
VFIKADGLWVLFVDAHFIDGVVFDAVFYQLPAQPFSPFFGRYKQHFDFSAFYSHKSDRFAFSVFGNKQMRYVF